LAVQSASNEHGGGREISTHEKKTDEGSLIGGRRRWERAVHVSAVEPELVSQLHAMWLFGSLRHGALQKTSPTPTASFCSMRREVLTYLALASTARDPSRRQRKEKNY
jgi:hypothetical protein